MFLYYDTTSFGWDLVKILLSVGPNLFTRSTFYVSFHSGPVFAEQEESYEADQQDFD